VGLLSGGRIRRSTAFTLPGLSNSLSLDEDGAGNVRVFYTTPTGSKVIIRNTGTINYDTGNIVLAGFNPSFVAGGELSLTVTPKFKNITQVRNEILLINEANIYIYNSRTGDFITSGTSTTIGNTATLNEVPYLTSVTI